ncbi:hypothetical protein [Pseudohalioglobus sediminis]|uniref:hypothetical protein n=1 Tax=Pseudohalioglobus sediminis TaxID=2606449 RepID=UPI00165EE064|nr:hypothetical protein [Pseudohalioglobus sediminis]
MKLEYRSDVPVIEIVRKLDRYDGVAESRLSYKLQLSSLAFSRPGTSRAETLAK